MDKEMMQKDNPDTDAAKAGEMEALLASPRAVRAMALFKEGYNCSQAVVLAFEDLYDVDARTILRLSSSFGGGMGRLREVCGSVSGMFLVAGLLYGYDSPVDVDGKTRHYERIQQLAHEFQALNGSIVCRELLGLGKKEEGFVPEKRTEEYYKKRPCMQLIGMSAAILERYQKTFCPDIIDNNN